METLTNDDALDYLCVDDFLRDAVGTRALASAFELGLIDQLHDAGHSMQWDLATRAGLDAAALRLLLGLLQAGGVVALKDGEVALTTPFLQALQYRDLLEAKLDFVALVVPDFHESFSVLLREPERFFSTARVFELFSYQRCFDPTAENIANTERWVRITTALTRYESRICVDRHDFSRYETLLDVGGNSGEFALQVCKRHAKLRATIYDLPLVCDSGERHVASEPEAPRMQFVRAGRSGGALPVGFDLVTFKSMLHDWPEAEMRQFLARAYRALKPGGTLLIYERCRPELGTVQVPYSMIPLLLFYRSYRIPEDYSRCLEESGFSQVRIEELRLDMPFMLITATK